MGTRCPHDCQLEAGDTFCLLKHIKENKLLMKILVITGEPLPIKGIASTGAGLRAFGLADALISRGLDVTAAMPSVYKKEGSSNEIAVFKTSLKVDFYNRKDITEYIKQQNPDVLVVQHWGLMSEIGDVNCPIAIDLAGPHLLERLYWGDKEQEKSYTEKISALSRADFLVCSGNYQRHYFLPFLQTAGWNIKDEYVLPVIYYSLPPQMREKSIQDDQCRFIYGGFFLPWQDPSKPLLKLIEILEREKRGYLDFYGGPHPLSDVSGGAFGELIDKINKSERVIVHPVIPFDELIEQYSHSSVALDLMSRNPERELAFTSRTIVYLWSGLPVIYNNYSELSNYIDGYKAGWTVDYDDEESYTKIFEYCLNNPDEIKKMGLAAQKLISEKFSNDKVIEPLYNFCMSPYFRKNKENKIFSFINNEKKYNDLKKNYDDLKSEFETFKGKLLFRLFKKSDLFYKIISPLIFIILLPVSIILMGLFLINDFFGKFKK